MKIEIEKEKCKGKYLLNISLIDDNERGKYVFFNHNKFKEPETDFMNLFNLNDENFLKENDIEYIKEDDNIIPIGIVDFQVSNRQKYITEELSCMVDDNDELYKCQKIIDNIVRAIEIKYQSELFTRQFTINKPTIETIDI